MNPTLFIGGSWVNAVGGGTLPVVNPSTEETFATVAAATVEDVDLAVKAARVAFDSGPWPRMSGSARAKVLRAIATGIRKRQDEIARLEVLDNGKPLPEAIWDIGDAAGCFDFYAGLADELERADSEEIPLQDARFASKVIREPIGVAAAVIPWNYPLLMAAWKVAPALAAGCTVVLKPSELTPLTALELGRIAEAAQLPPGALNIVTGYGVEAGQALVEHPGVDKVAFTGSVPTGSKIMAAAARDIKRISLELGGKSPFIVFDDVDIEQAVEWILFGIFWNQGQVCSATSRLLVQEKLYDRLIERIVEEAERITVGDGLEEGVLLGPLVSAQQLTKVEAAIARAKAQGARVVVGGGRPKGRARGYFLSPTVLVDAPLDSDAWKEEIFGPVLCVRSFDTEQEAIELANDTRFGLAGAIMSKDLERAERVAAALRAGIVWINCSQPTFTEAPWGGYKQSGIGRELGRWGLDNYLETKQVTRFVSDVPWGWYLK